jgi:hypothetical protein
LPPRSLPKRTPHTFYLAGMKEEACRSLHLVRFLQFQSAVAREAMSPRQRIRSSFWRRVVDDWVGGRIPDVLNVFGSVRFWWHRRPGSWAGQALVLRFFVSLPGRFRVGICRAAGSSPDNGESNAPVGPIVGCQDRKSESTLQGGENGE